MKKNITQLLILCVAILFASCSSDDENSNENDITGDLVGTWGIVSLEYSGITTTKIDGDDLIINFDGIAKNIDYTIKFSENPNEFEAEGSYDIELTTTFFGITDTQTIPVDDGSGTGTYSLGSNGDTITIDGALVNIEDGMTMTSGMENVSTITELTDTSLIITQESNQVMVENGITSSASTNSQIVFTRL